MVNRVQPAERNRTLFRKCSIIVFRIKPALLKGHGGAIASAAVFFFVDSSQDSKTNQAQEENR